MVSNLRVMWVDFAAWNGASDVFASAEGRHRKTKYEDMAKLMGRLRGGVLHEATQAGGRMLFGDEWREKVSLIERARLCRQGKITVGSDDPARHAFL